MATSDRRFQFGLPICHYSSEVFENKLPPVTEGTHQHKLFDCFVKNKLRLDGGRRLFFLEVCREVGERDNCRQKKDVDE